MGEPDHCPPSINQLTSLAHGMALYTLVQRADRDSVGEPDDELMTE